MPWYKNLKIIGPFIIILIISILLIITSITDPDCCNDQRPEIASQEFKRLTALKENNFEFICKNTTKAGLAYYSSQAKTCKEYVKNYNKALSLGDKEYQEKILNLERKAISNSTINIERNQATIKLYQTNDKYKADVYYQKDNNKWKFDGMQIFYQTKKENNKDKPK